MNQRRKEVLPAIVSADELLPVGDSASEIDAEIELNVQTLGLLEDELKMESDVQEEWSKG